MGIYYKNNIMQLENNYKNKKIVFDTIKKLDAFPGLKKEAIEFLLQQGQWEKIIDLTDDVLSKYSQGVNVVLTTPKDTDFYITYVIRKGDNLILLPTNLYAVVNIQNDKTLFPLFSYPLKQGKTALTVTQGNVCLTNTVFFYCSLEYEPKTLITNEYTFKWTSDEINTNIEEIRKYE